MSLQDANHQDLFNARNKVYMGLFHKNVALAEELKAFEICYNELQYVVFYSLLHAYINLFTRSNHQSLLAEVKEALTAHSPPTVLSTIPSTSIAAAPVTTSGVDSTTLQNNYPDVKFWTQRAYKNYLGEKKSIFEPGQDVRSLRGSGRLSKTGENVACDYIEMEDGKAVSGDTAAQIRKFCSSVFKTIKNTPTMTLPSNWSAIGITERQFVQANLYQQYPYLRLCEDNWKVTYLASRVLTSMHAAEKKRSGGVLVVSSKAEPEDVKMDLAASTESLGSLLSFSTPVASRLDPHIAGDIPIFPSPPPTKPPSKRKTAELESVPDSESESNPMKRPCLIPLSSTLTTPTLPTSIPPLQNMSAGSGVKKPLQKRIPPKPRPVTVEDHMPMPEDIFSISPPSSRPQLVYRVKKQSEVHLETRAQSVLQSPPDSVSTPVVPTMVLETANHPVRHEIKATQPAPVSELLATELEVVSSSSEITSTMDHAQTLAEVPLAITLPATVVEAIVAAPVLPLLPSPTVLTDPPPLTIRLPSKPVLVNPL